MTDQPTTRPAGIVLRVIVSLVLCALLLGGAAFALYTIYSTQPKAEREGATRKSAALVQTMTVTRGDYEPELVVLGNTRPAREVMLSPLIGGEIIDVDPAFVPGGIVRHNQLLLKLDPQDYQNQLVLRQSELDQARAQLAIEEGRQAVAKQELEALGRAIDPENRALVLREPQINAIRAQIKAAEAAVKQAELDVKRADVAAPFDAQIITRMANLGTRVSPGQGVARLVGIEEYWVIASVPLRSLERLTFSDTDAAGSSVELRLKNAWKPGVTRAGQVTRLIGELDEQTRLAQVLITVKDPLGRSSDAPPLLLDTIVEATIKGKPIRGVVRLNRDYLRRDNTVWVMADGKLSVRQAEVVFRDGTHAYIVSGLEEGDEVVTTDLSAVVDGMPLRREGEPAPPARHGSGASDE